MGDVEGKSGAFVTGLLQTIVNEGKNARIMLRNHEYDTEEERQALLDTSRKAKAYEPMLEQAKKNHGL